MIRKFNYTGRIKLKKVDVPVELHGIGSVRKFAARLNLGEYQLPADAKVFVEAYENVFYMRFPFGTVNQVTPPDELALTEFPGSDAVRFRVKVVDATGKNGRLLASVDGILPGKPEEKDQSKSPLLPVRSKDLGQQVWVVEYPVSTEDLPVLCMHTEAGDPRILAQQTLFKALVLPAILREVLTKIVFVDEYREMDDESDWRSRWLCFGQKLMAGGEPPPGQIDEDETRRWIEDVVAVFSSSQKCLASFLEFQQEETQ